VSKLTAFRPEVSGSPLWLPSGRVQPHQWRRRDLGIRVPRITRWAMETSRVSGPKDLQAPQVPATMGPEKTPPVERSEGRRLQMPVEREVRQEGRLRASQRH